MRGRAGLSLLAASLLVSCETQKPPPQRLADENALLGGEIAANVGDEKIPLSLVASVARKQEVTPREALRKIVDDAIAAQAAKSRGLDRELPASWLLVAARGRFAADKIFEESRKKGPPTDEEVKILSEMYWPEVDRPPTIRVVHAVTQVKKPEHEEAARAVAEAIREAVADTKTADEFLAKAAAVKTPPEVKIIAQPLPPITEEGLSPEMTGTSDPAFVKGAYAIKEIGGISPIVKSSFGFHVIRLGERIPEHRVPLETRRSMFTDEAAKLRARSSVKARLDALRAVHNVEISTTAEALMRSVPIKER